MRGVLHRCFPQSSVLNIDIALGAARACGRLPGILPVAVPGFQWRALGQCQGQGCSTLQIRDLSPSPQVSKGLVLWPGAWGLEAPIFVEDERQASVEQPWCQGQAVKITADQGRAKLAQKKLVQAVLPGTITLSSGPLRGNALAEHRLHAEITAIQNRCKCPDQEHNLKVARSTLRTNPYQGR